MENGAFYGKTWEKGETGENGEHKENWETNIIVMYACSRNDVVLLSIAMLFLCQLMGASSDVSEDTSALHEDVHVTASFARDGYGLKQPGTT